MQILTTIAETQTATRALRADGPLGLVPTMGALHAGHLSLVAAAKKDCAHVAATIFVNPLQFAPNEDFTRYPRTFDEDCAQLEAAGVDILFAPSSEVMYPPNGTNTFVEVSGIGDRLDGAHRPGHFRGVATVVAKLFHILGPDRAYFGQKDAAQLAVLRAMARDLNFPIELIACPIVREPDGLAMSSRNRYLSFDHRRRATILHRALTAAAQLHANGKHKPDQLIAATRNAIAQDHNIAIEYVAAVDPNTLLPLDTTTHGALLALAIKIGKTRLIDNILLEPAHG
jgi:pantoate--beta-alanine ligase